MEKDNKLDTTESKELLEKSDEIIRKLDKESATRIFSGQNMKKFFYILAVLVSLYHLYTATFGPPVTLKNRSLHVGMMMSMAFMMYPFSKKSDFSKVSIMDWLWVLLSCIIPAYVWLDYMGIVDRTGMPDTMDVAMATILVISLLEASRRVTGNALPILSIIFIIQYFLPPWL